MEPTSQSEPSILVVDDEQFVMMATKQILGQVQINGVSLLDYCCFASTGQEAIDQCVERLDNKRQQIKLIFMDIGLGEGQPDGLEITK